MAFHSGTPDSRNERDAESDADNYRAIQAMDNGDQRQPDQNQRAQGNTVVNFVEQQVISSAASAGVKGVLKTLKGGASEAAGGASVVEETVPILEDVAEIGAVFL